MSSSKKSSKKVDWKKSLEIEKMVRVLIKRLQMSWIDPERIYCFESEGSKARAYARIWGLSRIWQISLKEKPAYALEVLSENFNNLSKEKKIEVLLHELSHIPKTFSGALVPHFRRGKRNFGKKVKDLIEQNRNLFKLK